MDKTIREDSESGDPKQGDADLTIREEGAEVQGTDETLVEGASTGDDLVLARGALFEGYRLKEPLKVTSAEADLWQVEDARSGKPYVLKLYRYGIKPKEEIGHAIRNLRREHIVEVLKSGESEGRVYEIQESIENGSLAQWGKKGRLSDKEGKEVLRELSNALTHLHEANVVHRDIKPSNILIRTEEPLNLVLIDFGIASMADLSLHLTNLNRTAAYCAPETIQGVVGKESDWWSVGVVMLEMLEGRHPWGGMTEQAINFQLVSRGMKVPEGVGREWGQLLKGLLTRDGERRWGAGEVSKWLGGSRDVRVYYEGDVEQEQKRDHRPYKLRGKEIYEPKELAVYLGENWPEGVKHLGRGLITDWVKGELKDQGLASDLTDITEDEELDGEQKLSAALLLMNEELPLMWKGEVVTREWVAGNLDKTEKLLGGKLPGLLKEARGEDWLLESGEVLKEILNSTSIKLTNQSIGKTLDNEQTKSAVALALNPKDPLIWKGQEVTRDWMTDNIDLAFQLLDSRMPQWVKRLRNENWMEELAGVVAEVTKDERLDAEQRKSVVALVLGPQKPLVWKGQEVTRDWMTGNVDSAIKLLDSSLPKWVKRLKKEGWMEELAGVVAEARRDIECSEQFKAIEKLIINPNRTFSYMGHEVTPDWIHGNAVESVKLLKSSVPGWLSRLKGDRWLEEKQTELNKKREKYLPKIKVINPVIDEQKVDELLVLPVEEVVRKISGLVELIRTKYFVHETNPKFNELLQKTELSYDEGIVLLLCDQTEFIEISKKELIDSADAGDAGALYRLGLEKLEGKDDQLGVKYIRQAAEKGHIESQLKLAEIQAGNNEEVTKWLLAAAEQGNALAQRKLGQSYLKGAPEAAADREFDRQHPESTPVFYEQRWRLKKPPKKLVKKSSSVPSKLNFINKIHKSKAIDWLEKAAAQGDDEAIRDLEKIFEEEKRKRKRKVRKKIKKLAVFTVKKIKKLAVFTVFSITLLGCLWFASPKLRLNVLQFFASNPEKQFQIAVKYFSKESLSHYWMSARKFGTSRGREAQDIIQILQKAADQGSFSAKVALGDMYNESFKEWDEAAELDRREAEDRERDLAERPGTALAINEDRLRRAYHREWDSVKNNEEARKYYLDALSSTKYYPNISKILGGEKNVPIDQAKQFDSVNDYNSYKELLAYIKLRDIYNIEGGKQNISIASDLGLAAAKIKLGQMYLEGEEKSITSLEAFFHLMIASGRGEKLHKILNGNPLLTDEATVIYVKYYEELLEGKEQMQNYPEKTALSYQDVINYQEYDKFNQRLKSTDAYDLFSTPKSASFTSKSDLVNKANFYLGLLYLVSLKDFDLHFLTPAVVKDVIKDLPAYKSGIIKNDRIIKIGAYAINNQAELRLQLQKLNKIKTNITVIRDGERIEFPITPRQHTDVPRAIIGITFYPPTKAIDILRKTAENKKESRSENVWIENIIACILLGSIHESNPESVGIRVGSLLGYKDNSKVDFVPVHLGIQDFNKAIKFYQMAESHLSRLGQGLSSWASETYAPSSIPVLAKYSQWRIGVIHEKSKNYNEALRWYKKAAGKEPFGFGGPSLSETYFPNGGYSGAQYSLGNMYLKGLGVVKNTGKGISWIYQAANAGDPNAQYTIGLYYDSGVDPLPGRSLNYVSKNNFKAIDWINKAAAKDSAIQANILKYKYGINPTKVMRRLIIF